MFSYIKEKLGKYIPFVTTKEKAMDSLYKFEESISFLLKNKEEAPVPVKAMLPYEYLGQFLKYHNNIPFEDDEKKRFTHSFYELSDFLRKEVKRQLENGLFSEKDIKLTPNVLDECFTNIVKHKVKDNEWLLKLVNEYPDLYIVNKFTKDIAPDLLSIFERVVKKIVNQDDHNPVQDVAMATYFFSVPFLKCYYVDILFEEDLKVRFTKSFYEISNFLRKEIQSQKEKDIIETKNIIDGCFTNIVKSKVKDNEWLLKLINEYPELYVY